MIFEMTCDLVHLNMINILFNHNKKKKKMLEDIRSQLNQSKATHESEMSRMESRIMNKIDETQRNSDKFDRFDRKLDDYTNQMNKRFMTFEDEFQRNLNKLASSTEVKTQTLSYFISLIINMFII